MVILRWQSIFQIFSFGVAVGYWLTLKSGWGFMWLMDFDQKHPKWTFVVIFAIVAVIGFSVWLL